MSIDDSRMIRWSETSSTIPQSLIALSNQVTRKEFRKRETTLYVRYLFMCLFRLFVTFICLISKVINIDNSLFCFLSVSFTFATYPLVLLWKVPLLKQDLGLKIFPRSSTYNAHDTHSLTRGISVLIRCTDSSFLKPPPVVPVDQTFIVFWTGSSN